MLFSMRCPSCGWAAEPDHRFCARCGAPLGDRPAKGEERKVVTVVFADLVGFTSRAERLDPEDVHALLKPYYARLRSELERFGGTVEKFIGDAVMAVFGAPTAHEDDPERAVRAALAIRDWLLEQPELQVRIAVNTGEALVALDARPEAGEGMVSGDVINTAARLQATALVNGILVGEAAYRASARVIRYRDAEPVLAKGKRAPLAVWEAIEARSRLGSEVGSVIRTPLVGRDRELRLLTDSLARVGQDRTAQLVTVVGVPGIGKSRLIAELFRAIEHDPTEIIQWRQGRSLPYGDGVTFWVLAEMVKAQAGVLETDAPDQAAAKLRTSIAGVIPDTAEAGWIESHLRPLAGLGAADPGRGDRRDESFTAWRRFFERLADQHPLALIFEDVHWADDNLLDFIDSLVELSVDVPLLVVCGARPELLERRSGWGGGKRNAVTLSLSPLSDAETAALISGLARRPLIPADTRRTLLTRAGGNPLYAEQYVRMLVERGDAADLPLPETVQGIIAARIDGLALAEKQVLQDAAVIGKVFWPGAAAAVGERTPADVEACLKTLQRREFVQRSRRSSAASEAEYSFLHVLMRDVAYGEIPRAQRAEKHRRAAGWLTSFGRAEDNAEMVAHHYQSAVELRRTAAEPVDPDLAAEARVSLQEAGAHAFALSAYHNAGPILRVGAGAGPGGLPRAGPAAAPAGTCSTLPWAVRWHHAGGRRRGAHRPWRERGRRRGGGGVGERLLAARRP